MSKKSRISATPEGVSPFIGHVIKAFKNEYNNHDIITAQTLYEDIMSKLDQSINNSPISLNSLGQRLNIAMMAVYMHQLFL